MSKAVKTWNKTKVQNLIRHKSGRYYARTFRQGKEIWKAMRTSLLSVAKARLTAHVGEERKKKAIVQHAAVGDLSLADCLFLYREKIKGDPRKKPRTIEYWLKCADVLERTWLNPKKIDIRKVSRKQCVEWAATLRSEAPYIAPNATNPRRNAVTRYSARYFNHIVDCCRHVFEIAIESGAIYDNPARAIKKSRIHAKELTLPSRSQFVAMVNAIENSGSRHSRPCADFIQLLAFTGMRKSEAGWLTWRDCDFQRGIITVRGHPTTGTKNNEIREVPMIPQARELLKRIRSELPVIDPFALVAQVQECQNSLTAAATKAGAPRLTHHDLRHFFATIAIESGVDIPTVARWLGHKDGGALAMKTYGHLRNEHSLAAAQKVNFN